MRVALTSLAAVLVIIAGLTSVSAQDDWTSSTIPEYASEIAIKATVLDPVTNLLYMTGLALGSLTFNGGSSDVILIVANATTGEVVDSVVYGTSGSDFAYGIVLDPLLSYGFIAVTTDSVFPNQRSAGGFDLALLVFDMFDISTPLITVQAGSGEDDAAYDVAYDADQLMLYMTGSIGGYAMVVAWDISTLSIPYSTLFYQELPGYGFQIAVDTDSNIQSGYLVGSLDSTIYQTVATSIGVFFLSFNLLDGSLTWSNSVVGDAPGGIAINTTTLTGYVAGSNGTQGFVTSFNMLSGSILASTALPQIPVNLALTTATTQPVLNVLCQSSTYDVAGTMLVYVNSVSMNVISTTNISLTSYALAISAIPSSSTVLVTGVDFADNMIVSKNTYGTCPTCNANQVCLFDGVSPSLGCACKSGYSGSSCAISSCAGITCRNGGTCQPHTSRPLCACASGWFGDFCEDPFISLGQSRLTQSLVILPTSIQLNPTNGLAYIGGGTSVSFLATGNRTGFSFDMFLLAVNLTTMSVVAGQYYGTAGDEIATSVAIDTVRNVGVIVGQTSGTIQNNTAFGGLDGALFAVNLSTGALLFGKQFGTASDEDAAFVALDSVSGVAFVVGRTNGAFPGQQNRGLSDAYLLAVNITNGATIFVRQIGSTGTDTAKGLQLDSVRRVGYITGGTTAALPGNTFAGQTDAYLWAFNMSTGSTVYLRQWGTGGVDLPLALALLNGYCYVAGVQLSTALVTSATLYMLRQTDGSLLSTMTIAGEENFAIAADPISNVVTAAGQRAPPMNGAFEWSVLSPKGNTTFVANTLAAVAAFGVALDPIRGMTYTVGTLLSGAGFLASRPTNKCTLGGCLNGGTCTVNSVNGSRCLCGAGFTGSFCQTNMDECASSPCQNRGNCTDGINSFTCSCFSGFLGPTCSVDTTGCVSSPCANGGTCNYVSSTVFSCTCPTGFTDTRCGTAVNLCLSSPCVNGGVCSSLAGQLSCACSASFTGPRCQTQMVTFACSSSPCSNGGVCNQTGSQFACVCPRGFTGALCQTDINECLSSPCINGGSCSQSSVPYQYVCACPSGFTGDTCAIDLNECLSSPCSNGGLCVDALNHFSCTCAPGLTGAQCQIDINECASSPCINGASCANQMGSFACICAAGFTGSLCANVIDQCSSIPCLNGASCTPVTGVLFTCTCALGFTGQLCESDLNECMSSPCVNGGSCTQGSLANLFLCACAPGFTGSTCQTDINECASSPCSNGASCTQSSAPNTFSCLCANGYSGPTCSININECASSPCVNGALCSDGVNGYVCICSNGFTGSNCLSNINECQSSPCLNSATCTDLVGQFSCTCAAGFTGFTCQTNSNECLSSPCVNGATCVDGVNGFTCSCAGGFFGPLCAGDVDECLSSPCSNVGSCHDLTNAFSCSCAAGFTGAQCQTDVNECSSSPCLNGGSCAQSATPNLFTCVCASGLTGSTCQSVINQCLSSPCSNGGICTQTPTPNLYTCACPAGFTGTACQTDLNECASSPCTNGASCVQGTLPNTFVCLCATGFTGSTCNARISPCLSSPCSNGAVCVPSGAFDSFSCNCVSGFTGLLCQSDINECSSSPCANGGVCNQGTQANRVVCVCASGFTGSTCQSDIKECSSSPCQNGATCSQGNSPNLFVCVCSNGFTGVQCQTEVDECSSSPCVNGGSCANHIGSFTCVCETGFTGLTCQQIVVIPCRSNPCLNGGTCTNIGETGFTCSCPTSFTGATCQSNLCLCAAGQYQAGPCASNGPSASHCQQCSCPSGYYSSGATCSGASTSNTLTCTACACPSNQYQTTTCTGLTSSNPVCQVCTPCASGATLISGCGGSTSDSVCAYTNSSSFSSAAGATQHISAGSASIDVNPAAIRSGALPLTVTVGQIASSTSSLAAQSRLLGITGGRALLSGFSVFTPHQSNLFNPCQQIRLGYSTANQVAGTQVVILRASNISTNDWTSIPISALNADSSASTCVEGFSVFVVGQTSTSSSGITSGGIAAAVVVPIVVVLIIIIIVVVMVRRQRSGRRHAIHSNQGSTFEMKTARAERPASSFMNPNFTDA